MTLRQRLTDVATSQQLQATKKQTDAQEGLQPPGVGREEEGVLPRAFKGCGTADILSLDLQPPEL